MTFSNANQPGPQSSFQLAEPFRAPASVLPSSIALDRSSMASSSRPQPYTEHGPSNAHCLVYFRSNPNTKSLHVGKCMCFRIPCLQLLYMFTTKTHAACAKPRTLFLANVVGHSEDGTHPMINNTTVVVVSDQGGFDIHFSLTLLVDWFLSLFNLVSALKFTKKCVAPSFLWLQLNDRIKVQQSRPDFLGNVNPRWIESHIRGNHSESKWPELIQCIP